MNEMKIGEGFVGEGAHAAHVNTVLGPGSGPVGTAWATALATPRAGHIPFVAVAQPGVAVRPATLFVNKAPLEAGRHSELTWGAAQAGVAAGVADAVAQGIVDREQVDYHLLIVAVWVDPAADDEEAVFANNREATLTALGNARAGLPTLQNFLDAAAEPSNPFYPRRPTSGS